MYHTVVAGETLGSIAKRYLGSASKYTVIAQANNMADPNQIYVGQKLLIPDTDSPASDASTATPNTPASKPQSQPSQVLVTDEQLCQIFYRATADRVHSYAAAINLCLEENKINTSMRIAQFLAQIAHESGCLRYTAENLNYSAQALMQVFGKYFPTEALANAYARQPEKIANRVYASRMGNGNEASGDGWRYRGRGFIQLTGKSNYASMSQDEGVDFVSNPDLCAQDPQWIVGAAGWFWTKNNLNALADQDNIKAITKKINGGYNGLSDREAYLKIAKRVLMPLQAVS